MADTYTGAEVYTKLQESMDFMRDRISTLEGDLNVYQRREQNLDSQMDDVSMHLASAYLIDADLHDADSRDAIQSNTGVDLAYVVDKFSRQKQTLTDQQMKIKRDRLYLMRSSVVTEVTGDGELVFADQRLNEVLAIEDHPGYNDEEGLLKSKYVTDEHKKGLFGFRHRRLTKLSQAVAEDLGYDSFEEMERGHVGDMSALEERAGRLELRYSIPILALHSGDSLRTVHTNVGKLIGAYDSLEQALENLITEETNFATVELAKHFEVVRLESLGYDSISGAQGHIDTLGELREEGVDLSRSMDAVRTEMATYSESIAEISTLLAKSSKMRTSTKTIPASIVDKIFAHESGTPIPVNLPSMRELDMIIARDFPRAVGFSGYTRTKRHVGTQSSEYKDVVRRAGGVGKWTTWKKR
ncbi:hypothetical protein HOC96_07690 [archaeon]|nr:hypothetical protein [archaeon]